MECVPTNTSDSMSVLSILFDEDKDENEIKVAPSTFNREMSLSTEERTEKLKRPIRKVRMLSETNVKTFKVTPDIVIFQNFTVGKIHSVNVSLLNLQEISVPLQVVEDKSQYFSIFHCSEVVCTKIAPGMSYQFKVNFAPEELKDYQHQVTFITDTEKFTLFLLAIGPRPLLNIPDDIVLPETAVKTESEKKIWIRNDGKSCGRFSLLTHKPFEVSPKKARIGPDETMELTFSFKPRHCGSYKSEMIVYHESSEKLRVNLTARACEAEIYLERRKLLFKDTYEGLSDQKDVKLHNNSNYIIQYQWKMFPSIKQDREMTENLKNKWKTVKEHESLKCNKLETYNVIDFEGHTQVYERIYQDEVKEFEANDQFLYENKIFEIEPMTGEIYPRTSRCMKMFFRPHSSRTYESTAYLEVTGKEERLPLQLAGVGLGPEVTLNVQFLNVNEIFVNIVHRYEIVAYNKGPIPACVAFVPQPKTQPLREINCVPPQQTLQPDECRAFVLEFSSNHEGGFIEEIKFQACDSEELLTVLMTGKVICPLLSSDVSEVDFGCVSIGIPTKREIHLINPSIVAIYYEIEIPHDGDLPALTCEDFANLTEKVNPVANIKEFEFSPSCGTAQSQETVTLEITLIPNFIRSNVLILTVTMWNNYKINIKLKYRAEVPILEFYPSEISIRFCFVSYPYNRTIAIKNKTNLTGYFCIVMDLTDPYECIQVAAREEEGYIKPYERIEIPLTITITALGEHELPFYIKLFGEQPICCCTIKCNGQGAVVDVKPDIMDFGEIKLLREETRYFTLMNESPIPAKVKTDLLENTIFTIDPTELELEALAKGTITVSTLLCNPGKNTDSLVFNIENADHITIKICAFGVGTSVLCEPELKEELYLGILLTRRVFRYPIKLTNKGFRHHKLKWSNKISPKSNRNNEEVVEEESVFTIHPDNFELAFGNAEVITLEACHFHPGLKEENFYCHATIQGNRNQSIILHTHVSATFADPTVEFSKRMLCFRIDIGPNNFVDAKLQNELIIENVTGVPIKFSTELKPPFYIVSDGGGLKNSVLVTLEMNEKMIVIVKFNPVLAEDRECCTIQSVLKLSYCDHPKLDTVRLIGEINYPNVDINPSNIDFCCLSNNTRDYTEIIMKNVSPLPVKYHWEWEEDYFTEEFVDPATPTILHALEDNISEHSDESFDIETLYEDLEIIEIPLLKQTEIIEKIDDMYVRNVEVYDHAYVEDYRYTEYLQIQYTLPPLIQTIEDISRPERNQECFEAMQDLLCPIFMNPEERIDTSMWTIHKVQPVMKAKNAIESVLDITPYEGFLGPRECQLISVSFYPKPNTKVKAKAICSVLGGATRYVFMQGTASDMSYELDTDFIDFGRQFFCEICERKIAIRNTGRGMLEYSSGYLHSQDLQGGVTSLQPRWLSVEPKMGVLDPGAATELTVNYYPGIIGEFSGAFLLQIGCFPPIKIAVHGYAVFAQIHLALPRPDIFTCDSFWQYSSIATLSPELLKSINADCSEFTLYTTDYDKIPDNIRKRLEKDGWVIVNYSDFFPTQMDIELALERTLSLECLFVNRSKLKLHTINHKTLSIPDLIVTPYCIDFESVILGTCVVYTVAVCNYGPQAARVRILEKKKRSKFEAKAFLIELSKSHLQAGEVAVLSISFCPTYQFCPTVPRVMDDEIYLEVQHGPKIPVYVKAYVCTPKVACDRSLVDFGDVMCGDRLRKSIILRNVGPVGTIFTITLTSKTAKKGKYSGPFSIGIAKDFVQKDKEYVLDLFFEPRVGGAADARIILEVEQNPEKLVIILKGYGLGPSVQIYESQINFGAVLPYAIGSKLEFTVENPNSFPVEFFFPDFDYDVDREETILKLLGDYYKTKFFYVPPRVVGGGLPRSFIEFYHHILLQVGQKEMEQQSLHVRSMTESKSRSSHGSSRASAKAQQSSGVLDIDKARALLFEKTRSEMDELLKKQLQDIIKGTAPAPGFDPIETAFANVAKEPEMDLNGTREAIFLLFHGAPNTKHPYVSNAIAKMLWLPVYSIDRLFFEALLSNSTPAAQQINAVIDEKFLNIASECDLVSPPDDDAMDVLEKKVNLILSGKVKKPPATSKPKSKDSARSKSSTPSKSDSSKSSKKGKKDKAKKEPDVFMDLPVELITEVLTQKVKEFRVGVVIESLNSIILRKPEIALNVVLTSLGNARYIHFVLFSYTYEDYSAYNANMRLLAQQKKEEEIAKVLGAIDDMGTEEFLSLPLEYREIYKEKVLRERKLQSQQKKEALRQKLAEMADGKTSPGKHKPDSKAAGKTKSDKVTMTKSGSAKDTKGKGKDKKSSKSSKGSSKGSSKQSSKKGGKKEKLSPEEEAIRNSILSFEELSVTILHTMEYWDRRNCTLTKPLPTALSAKQSKKGNKAGKKGDKKTSPKKNASSSEMTSTPQLGSTLLVDEAKNLELGIPCWVIRDIDPEREVERIISYHLQTDPVLIESFTTVKASLVEVLVETSELFSVLHVPTTERHKNSSDVFSLDDVIDSSFKSEAPFEEALIEAKVTDSKESISKGSGQMKSARKQKRSKKAGGSQGSKYSQDRVSISSSLLKSGVDNIESVIMKDMFTSRRILQPGEQWQYCVTFDPKTLGYHKHAFPIEVTNATDTYSIHCEGICDIPKIDTSPEALYPKIIAARTERNAHKSCVYVRNSEIFDFGYIFLPKADENCFEPLTAEFRLKNVSSLPSEISVALRQPMLKVFLYEPEMLTVAAQVEETLNLAALPDKRQTFENQLLLSTRNNPKVEAVNMSCTGCHVNFIIRPKLINFDHALINQTSRQEIVLENVSDISVFWKIAEADKILKVFKLSSLKGNMIPSTKQQIYVECTPRDAQAIPKIQIMIHVYQLFYDDVKSNTPIYKDFLTVSTEVCTVNIAYSKDISMGNVKANIVNKKTYSFINRGKHEVMFQFGEVKTSDDPECKNHEYIRKMFSVNPTEGFLRPNVEFKVEVNFLCRKPVCFSKLPILRCTFSYPEYSLDIESFLVFASAKTHLPNYEIFPATEMHFGYQLIQTEKCQEVIIKNTGVLDFNYVIKSLRNILAEKAKLEKGKAEKRKGSSKSSSKASSGKGSKKSGSSKKSDEKSDKKSDKKSKGSSKTSKTSSKGSKSAKKKDSKKEVVRATTLNAGIFKIISSTGKVEPGKIHRIKIYCVPTDVKTYEETLLFSILEGNAQERKGKNLLLTADGAVPHINLDDFRFIFQEVHIVKTYHSIDEIKQVGPYGVFVTENQSLFFDNVVLNTAHEVHLHIRNIGQIATEIQCTITAEHNVFSVNPDIVNIEPFTSTTISLIFTPSAVDSFEGYLKITYRCPQTHPGITLECKLEGKGHLPEVKLLEPDISKSSEMCFNATLMGACSCKDIRFRNVGEIDCAVLLEVAGDIHDVFSLMPKTDTVKLLKIWNSEVTKSMRHTNVVELKPGEMAGFELQFVPRFDTLFNCTLKLHIVDNPFESISIPVTAQAFDESVTIEGLPAKLITFTSDTHLTSPSLVYDLEFKNCPVNVLKKKCFKIINHSSNDTYRFQLSNQSPVAFVPCVGHLKPQFSKEIVCTMLTENPVTLNNERVDFTVCKVFYLEAQQKLLSWDERQQLIVWKPEFESEQGEVREVNSNNDDESNSLHTTATEWSEDSSSVKFRSVRVGCEPKVEIEPGSEIKMSIVLNILAGYCSYECSTNELGFPDTFAFQQRTQSFEVTNTSNVNLEIQWSMWMDERFPRRINSPVFNESPISDSDSLIVTESMKRLKPLVQPMTDESDVKVKCSETSLFSPPDANSARSNDSWCEQNALPFAVSPASVTLLPEQTGKFSVTFKPQDVFQYLIHLEGKVPNLRPDLTNIRLLISGRSILPIYHFDLERVDIQQLREGRRFCKEVTDENTQVVSFEAIGLAKIDVRKFKIVNPTRENLQYEWHPAESNGEDLFFNCLTPSGVIPRGKTAEAVFTFSPECYGVHEAFYNFEVAPHNLRTVFLLYGVARKPRVYFERPHVNLKPSVLGTETAEEIKLKNDDVVDCKFKILRDSLASCSVGQFLNVEPMCGELRAQSSEVLKITFRPKKMGEVAFNIKCAVQCSEQPIVLGVTGQCLKLKPIVTYENFYGQRITVKSKIINDIKLKPMVPYQKEQIIFTIANAGQTGFYFIWFVNAEMYSDRVKFNFKDQEGYVPTDTETFSTISITPLKNILLKGVKIKLQIPYGPTYILRLTGTASNSLFCFSFDSYDFGQCLVQNEETQCNSTLLKFSNLDVTPIIVEYNIRKVDSVTVNFKSKMVMPKKTEEIPIYFHPMEVTTYHNLLPFFVNSKIYTVSIHGEGVPLLLDVVNPSDKFIDLGCTTVGKPLSRVVKVINNSVILVDAKFDMSNRLPYFFKKVKTLPPEFDMLEQPFDFGEEKTEPESKGKKKGKKGGKEAKGKKGKKKEGKAAKKAKKSAKSAKSGKSTKSTTSSKNKKGKKEKKGKQPPATPTPEVKLETAEEKEQRLIAQSLLVLPKMFVKIHPKHTFDIQIRYNPTEPMKCFTEKISYQVQDTVETLCIVKAGCLEMNYYFDKNAVDFGNIIFGRTVSQRLILYNAGDVGGRYKWTLGKGVSEFKIFPMDGFAAPHTEVLFNVSFQPAELYKSYKVQVKCIVENYEKSLLLEMTGNSVNPPSPKDVLKFECPVRELATNVVTITNATYASWNITPVMTGQYFTVPPIVCVKPNTATVLQITYRPLCMSRGVPHEGSLLLHLPDQTTLNYKLIGTAREPTPVDKFAREITCKACYTETLPVHNWLNSAQEFYVITQNDKKDAKDKMLYKLLGNNVIDVPANGIREYKWTIYVLKEGVLDLKIIFHNVKTNEYLFYQMHLDVKKCEPLTQIELSTCVRKTVQYSLPLQNPIRTPIAYNVSCACPLLNFQRFVEVPPLTEHELVITFKPTTVETIVTLLEAVSADVGTYAYTFKLTGIPPVPEPAIYFTTPLGDVAVQTLVLKNDLEEKVEFIAKYDHDAFYSVKVIPLEPKEQIPFEITFDPSKLGRVQAYLTLNSIQMGQYIYPLIAMCLPPKPQGPLLVRPGVYRKISFKNPFKEIRTFTVAAKPEYFYVAANTIEIEGKKQGRILAGVEPYNADSAMCMEKYPRTGKVIIKCADATGDEPVKWTVYLEEEVVYGPNVSERDSMSSASYGKSNASKSVKSSRSNKSTLSAKSTKSTNKPTR